eukprot:2508886-Pyramimonas_sp.AAC.3
MVIGATSSCGCSSLSRASSMLYTECVLLNVWPSATIAGGAAGVVPGAAAWANAWAAAVSLAAEVRSFSRARFCFSLVKPPGGGGIGDPDDADPCVDMDFKNACMSN